MASTCKIRPAVSNDAPILSALALRSKAHWGYSRDFIESCEAELSVRPSDIDDDKVEYAVVEDSSAIVGFYALEKLSDSQFELEALFVEPEYIGMGFGRKLIQHALQEVGMKGGGALLIQGDPNAKDFYLAAGGKQIGTRESDSIPGRFLPLFEIVIRDSGENTA